MARRKKQETTPQVSETSVDENTIAAASAEQPLMEAMPDEPSTATDTVANVVEEPVARRGQFRSWVVDQERGYTRMTDEVHHCLILQFEEKPPPVVLAAVKGAGFQFKPDYYGQRNAWVRPNDFEGRLQVESIEKLLRSVSTVRESASL